MPFVSRNIIPYVSSKYCIQQLNNHCIALCDNEANIKTLIFCYKINILNTNYIDKKK